MKERNVAIVLAGGVGKRMNSLVPKQFLQIEGKPILYYSLKTFEDSFIDEIILVTTKDSMDYCKSEIIDRYGFKKVTKIIPGGKERYNSVYNGLEAIENANYVYIHDGARPCIDESLLKRGYESVVKHKATICAMPVKDTVKVVKDGIVDSTPDRSRVYIVQTPQIFQYNAIKEAYDNMFNNSKCENITDDAMVMEQFGTLNVAIFEGSYLNIKVTTPEDMRFVALSIIK